MGVQIEKKALKPLISTNHIEERDDQIVNAGFVVTKLFNCHSTSYPPTPALLSYC